MSEQKEIKFRYNEKELIVPLGQIPNFQKAISLIQKEYFNNNSKMEKLFIIVYSILGNNISIKDDDTYQQLIKTQSNIILEVKNIQYQEEKNDINKKKKQEEPKHSEIERIPKENILSNIDEKIENKKLLEKIRILEEKFSKQGEELHKKDEEIKEIKEKFNKQEEELNQKDEELKKKDEEIKEIKEKYLKTNEVIKLIELEHYNLKYFKKNDYIIKKTAKSADKFLLGEEPNNKNDILKKRHALAIKERIENDDFNINSRRIAKEHIKSLKNRIKHFSKNLLKIPESQRLIILKESSKYFESIFDKILNDQEIKDEEKIMNKIKKIRDEINKIHSNLKIDSINVDKVKLFENIIKFLEKNPNKTPDKKLYNKLYNIMINIEYLNDKIYLDKEKKNISDKNIEKTYIKIGKEKLNKLFKIDDNLNQKISDFKRNPTILKIHFIKINNDGNFYKQIKIDNDVQPISSSFIQIELNKFSKYKDFEVQMKIYLIDGEKENEFIINANIFQTNNYYLFIDIFEEKALSADIVYYSKINKLLPKNIKICGLDLEILDSIYNMKRISLININKSGLFRYLKNYFYYSEISKISTLLEDHKNLFINIIKDENLNYIKIYKNIKYEIIDLSIEEKELITKVYNDILINPKIELEEFKRNLAKVARFFTQSNFQKIKDIIKKFLAIPFFLLYNDSIPSNEDIAFLEKISIIQIINYHITDNNLYSDIIFSKIKYFLLAKNKYEKLDNKKKFFVTSNLFKYLINTKDENNFNYELIEMEDLPEYSPYIESELFYRKIISSLKNNSKLSFLYLQLNSGAGNDLISDRSWYQIKMIPLILIQNHMLNDFFPYFFIYNSSKTNNLAFNNTQTHIKSYNEIYIQKNDENVSLHKSNLNKVKILYRKFHEYSHSKFSGNYKMQLSPQFLFKNNLSVLNNDKNLTEEMITLYIKNAQNKYIKKAEKDKKNSNSNVGEVKEEDKLIVFINDNDNENYIEEIYQNEEDEEDEFEGNYVEKKVGESGFALEYYFCGNYFCSNGIARCDGNLDILLNIDLYIGESLIDLKRIIELKMLFNSQKKPSELANSNAFSLNEDKFQIVFKKEPYEMYTYNDFEIYVNE